MGSDCHANPRVVTQLRRRLWMTLFPRACALAFTGSLGVIPGPATAPWSPVSCAHSRRARVMLPPAVAQREFRVLFVHVLKLEAQVPAHTGGASSRRVRRSALEGGAETGPAAHERDVAEELCARRTRINREGDAAPRCQDSSTRGAQHLQYATRPHSQSSTAYSQQLRETRSTTITTATGLPSLCSVRLWPGGLHWKFRFWPHGARGPQARRPAFVARKCCSTSTVGLGSLYFAAPFDRGEVTVAIIAKKDTATRYILVGDIFQDRRQPGRRDAAASQRQPHHTPPDSQPVPQGDLWMTAHFRSARFGTPVTEQDRRLLADLCRASAMACTVSRCGTAWPESLEGAISDHQSWAVLCRHRFLLLLAEIPKGSDRDAE